MSGSTDKNIKSIYSNGDYLENNEEWHEEDSPYKASFVQKMIIKNKVTVNFTHTGKQVINSDIINLEKVRSEYK